MLSLLVPSTKELSSNPDAMIRKYVARQPILDRQQFIYGYEILFRNAANLTSSGYEDHSQRSAIVNFDPNHATCSVISDSLFLHGLEKIADHRKIFINFTRDLLLDEFAVLLPKNSLVIEILEDVEPDNDVLSACRRLRDCGYCLALDDVRSYEQIEPYLNVIQMVKVDLLLSSNPERRDLVKRCHARGITLLAEKVETHEVFHQTKRMGFAYFQGFFFSKPEILSRRDMPSVKANYFRILQEIHHPDFNSKNVERIIKAEPSLCYKLLRFLNSPVFGLRSPIRSIRHAISMLGQDMFKRWVSLLVMASMGQDKPQALLIMSLVRAAWCESLASQMKLQERQGDLFLLGLLSVVDAMLDQPLEEVISQLPIADDIKAGLTHSKSSFGFLLQSLEAFERADWDKSFQIAASLGISSNTLPEGYQQALFWAQNIMPVSSYE